MHCFAIATTKQEHTQFSQQEVARAATQTYTVVAVEHATEGQPLDVSQLRHLQRFASSAECWMPPSDPAEPIKAVLFHCATWDDDACLQRVQALVAGRADLVVVTQTFSCEFMLNRCAARTGYRAKGAWWSCETPHDEAMLAARTGRCGWKGPFYLYVDYVNQEMVPEEGPTSDLRVYVEATQAELAREGRRSVEGVQRVMTSSIALLHLVGIMKGDKRLFAGAPLEDIDVTDAVKDTLRDDPWTLMGRLTCGVTLVELDPFALMFGHKIVVGFDVAERPPLDEAPLQCPIIISAFLRLNIVFDIGRNEHWPAGEHAVDARRGPVGLTA